MQVNTDYKQFLQMAQTGHYPLFFNDWLSESLTKEESLNYVSATKNIKNVFNNLSKHRTLEKKKTALISMETNERNDFIRSFFKVVEHEALKDLKTLQ